VRRLAIINDVPRVADCGPGADQSMSETTVVAEAADIDEAPITRIMASQPDVIVLDRRLPSGDGAGLMSRGRVMGIRRAESRALHRRGRSFPRRSGGRPAACFDQVDLKAPITLRVLTCWWLSTTSRNSRKPLRRHLLTGKGSGSDRDSACAAV